MRKLGASTERGPQDTPFPPARRPRHQVRVWGSCWCLRVKDGRGHTLTSGTRDELRCLVLICLSVQRLLGAGLSDPAEGTSVFLNPCVQERLPVGPYLGHLLLPTEGIKVRKGGVRMGCSLWPGSTPLCPLSPACPPGTGGLGH